MIQTTQEQRQKPSSVGLAWPPRYDGRNRRVKGFAPCLVESGADLTRMLNDTATVACTHRHRHATRVALRFFASPEMAGDWHESIARSAMSRLIEDGWNGEVEAAMEVSRVIPGYVLVYLGFNAPGRIAPVEVVAAERARLERVSTMQLTTREAAFAKLDDANLRIERLTHPSDADLLQITRLYRQAFQRYLFPITTRTVAEVVNNGNLTLIVRDSSGRIVSSLVAEHAPFAVGSRTLNMIELSEAATDRRCRGNGLLTALYLEVVDRLRGTHDPVDTIVYVESRAPWEPVNIATRRAGFELCGMTSQHCVIVSDRSPGMQYRGNLEDLGIWMHPNF